MDRYIFVNYAHESRDDVQGIIDRLNNAGLNVASSGGEEKVAGCIFVLNLRTEASHASKTYRRIMNYTQKYEKDSIQISIGDRSIDSDVDSQLDVLEELFKYKYKDARSASVSVRDAASGVQIAGPAAAPDVTETAAADTEAGNSSQIRSEREFAYDEAMKWLNGTDERKPDSQKAVEFFLQSANLGYAPAQYLLSVCYDEGRGVKHSSSEASKWREMAAYGGIVKAQSEMGYCYEYGQGVVRNMREAVRWYRMASEQGDVQAKNNLAYCYQKGRGVAKDIAQAIRLYTEAADAGHPSSQYNLGYCYWYGEGTETDKKKAIELFRKSMDGGNAKAAQMIRALYQYEYLHGGMKKADTADDSDA